MRWKAIWCLIWHKHRIFEANAPTRKCPKCGMYFRDGTGPAARHQRKLR